jgi:hypothetical protein
MRKSITAALSAAAIVSGAALLSAPVSAMTIGAPAGVLGAAQTISPVDDVAACWRYGWRGWGWYPCGGYWRGGPWGYHGGWGWRRGWRRW